MPISLSHADKARKALTKAQQKEIKGLYSQVSKDIKSQIARLDTATASGSMRSVYLKGLEKQVNEAMESVGQEVERITVNNMLKAAELVGQDVSSWLSKYNIQIAENYSHVATDIVESLVTGQLYEGDWTLSSAVWKNIKENQKDINMIVAKGLAENKSVADIANDLANYTNPHKLTKWNLVAPDGKRVYRSSVDYRAQRLARTMTSHAYQQSFIRATEKNPFVIDYVWVSSNGGRTCPLCADRDGQHYTAKDLPTDHPNGMCTWIANTLPDDEIIDQLTDWVNGDENEAIDEYAKSLGYDFSIKAPKPKKPEPKVGTYEWVDSKFKKFKKSAGFTDEQYEYFQVELCNADTRYQQAFRKVANSKSFKGFEDSENAFYKPSEGKVYMNFEKCMKQAQSYGFDTRHKTLFHEFGHAMDDILGSRNGKLSARSEFSKAFEKDLMALKDKHDSDPEKFMSYIKSVVSDDNSNGVQDIFSALPHIKTKEFDGSSLPKLPANWRHTDEYWTRKNAVKEAQSELFAHISASRCSDMQGYYIDEFFPNSTKAFEELLYSFVK